MIKSLTIRNFQSHQESHLDFVAGVNVIVGDSDSGKSAIFRALYWIRENRPTSTEYIRNGSGTEGKRGAKHLGTAEASIVIQRGEKSTTIIRTRGHDVNKYVVDTQSFEALGKDIPKEVADALRLDKINIQKQIDLPYLILESPGQVAATFNKFTNLDHIDEAISLVTSDLRDRAAKKNEIESQITRVQDELRTYSYLPDFEKHVEVFEEVVAERTAAYDKRKLLLDTVQAGEEYVTLIFNLETRISNKAMTLKQARSLLEKIADVSLKIAETRTTRTEFSLMVENYRDAQARLDELDVHLPSRQKELGYRKKLLTLESRRESTESKAALLRGVIDDIVAYESNVKQVEDSIEAFKQNLAKEKAKLGDVDTCITCGQKLDAKDGPG